MITEGFSEEFRASICKMFSAEVCNSFCLHIRIPMLKKPSRVFRRKQIRNRSSPVGMCSTIT